MVMGMGAASSSRSFVRHPQLSRQGQLVVDKLGQGGRAALQTVRSPGLGSGHITVATPPAARPRCLAASASVHHGCISGVSWGRCPSIVRCRTWFSAPQPALQLGASFESFRTQALVIEAALAGKEAPAQASSQETGPAPAVPGVEWEVRRWVVFSDLHLSRRTLDVCLQTLRHVHAEAAARCTTTTIRRRNWLCALKSLKALNKDRV